MLFQSMWFLRGMILEGQGSSHPCKWTLSLKHTQQVMGFPTCNSVLTSQRRAKLFPKSRQLYPHRHDVYLLWFSVDPSVKGAVDLESRCTWLGLGLGEMFSPPVGTMV